jgi:hypothetical protein
MLMFFSLDYLGKLDAFRIFQQPYILQRVHHCTPSLARNFICSFNIDDRIICIV